MIGRISRLVAICMAIMLISGRAGAQDQPDFFRIDGHPGQKVPKSLLTVVSVDLDRVELGEALAIVSEKANLNLSFNRDRIPIRKKVTVTMSNAYALEVMLQILNETGTELLVTKEGLLLIVPGRDQKTKDGVIMGRVVDQETGKPLQYTNISILGTNLGGTTDKEGRFKLERIPAGDHLLQFSFIGYRTKKVSVILDSTEDLNVELVPEAISIGEVVITPGQFTIMGEGPAVRQTLTERDLQTIPFGEDIYRAITRLPGIASSDFSAKFNVRGGENNEILLLIDGMELQEPFHLKDIEGGALSVIDVASIQGIDLLSGGFPVEYGDRMSGVLNIKTRKAPSDKKRTSLGLSFMNARVMSEGKFDNNKGSWLLSARRGYLDVVLDIMDEKDAPRPTYYDVLGKIGYELGKKHTISANFLHAGDRLNFIEDDDDEDKTQYDDSYAWLTLKSFPGPKLYIQSILSFGRLFHDRNGIGYEGDGETVEFTVSDGRRVDLFGLKQDWNLDLSDRLQWKWGIDFKNISAHYDYLSSQRNVIPMMGEETVVVDSNHIDLDPSGQKLGVYFANRLRPIRPLVAELGLRYDSNSMSNDNLFSPRLNFVFELSKQTFLRAGWGYFYQSQGGHQLRVAYGEQNYFPAERAEHWVGGFEHTFRNGFNLRLEGYYKDLTDLYPDYRKFSNVIEVFPEMQDDRFKLNFSSKRSRGIEAYLKYDRGGRWSWWASYALAYAEENIHSLVYDGIEYPGDNQYRPGRFDQRHTVYLDLNFRPNRNWHLNVSWQYHSGWPYTPRIIDSRELDDGSIEYFRSYGRYNGGNYPSYQRFDLRVNRYFYTSNGHISAFISLINLYNHGNVRDINYQWNWHGGAPFLTEVNEYWFKLLPSIGVTWNWDH